MLILLLVGTLGLGLVMRMVTMMLDPPGRRRVVTRAFWCLFEDRSVTTELEVEGWTLRPTDVRSCSTFDPPEAVICHKRCRDLPLAAPAGRR